MADPFYQEECAHAIEGIISSSLNHEKYVLPVNIIPDIDGKTLTKEANLLHLRRYHNMPENNKIGVKRNLEETVKTVMPGDVYVGYDFQAEENYTDRRFRVVQLTSIIKFLESIEKECAELSYVYLNPADISSGASAVATVPSFTSEDTHKVKIEDVLVFYPNALMQNLTKELLRKRGYSLTAECSCEKNQFYSAKKGRRFDIFDSRAERRKGKEVLLCEHVISACFALASYSTFKEHAKVILPFYAPTEDELVFYDSLALVRIQKEGAQKRTLNAIEKEIILWKYIGLKNMDKKLAA